MGVSLESLKPQFGKVYQMPDLKGAIVTNVQDAQSPAGKAGLKPGDIITEVDGSGILSSQDLIAKVASIAPDTEIILTYYRETGANLEKATTKLKLSERKTNSLSTAETPDAPKTLGAPPVKLWGLNVVELTPALAALAKYDGLKGALVKSIDPSSFLADVGDLNGQNMLFQGDLIQRVNRTPVASVAEFTAAIAKLKTGDPVVFHISRTNSAAKKAEPRLVQFTVQ
jgi:serine protease Do